MNKGMIYEVFRKINTEDKFFTRCYTQNPADGENIVSRYEVQNPDIYIEHMKNYSKLYEQYKELISEKNEEDKSFFSMEHYHTTEETRKIVIDWLNSEIERLKNSTQLVKEEQKSDISNLEEIQFLNNCFYRDAAVIESPWYLTAEER
jgi:hypothetical protein